jgi:hypothetical protein
MKKLSKSQYILKIGANKDFSFSMNASGHLSLTSIMHFFEKSFENRELVNALSGVG